MFARQAVHWMRIAVEGLPSAIQDSKISAVSRFSSHLRRLTSLNHLAREARPILSNGTMIQQMMTDLNKIDFNKIQVRPFTRSATPDPYRVLFRSKSRGLQTVRLRM